MARLTYAEKRLLKYPPTERTWECGNNIAVVRQDDTVKVRCGWLNSGRAAKCVGCGRMKPKKPQLVYPRYLVACQKAGIEPGTRWRESDTPLPARTRRKVRRK